MSYWCTVTNASAYTGSLKPVSCRTRFRRLPSPSTDSARPVARARSVTTCVKRGQGNNNKNNHWETPVVLVVLDYQHCRIWKPLRRKGSTHAHKEQPKPFGCDTGSACQTSVMSSSNECHKVDCGGKLRATAVRDKDCNMPHTNITFPLPLKLRQGVDAVLHQRLGGVD
jgi:hypothetical protein